jgi:pimeloyl-ACP methyl ester carboxylesterase
MSLKKISYKYTEISYIVNGNSDKSIIFLHGYLENKEIWNKLVSEGFENYKTIQIDILGHGSSGITKNASVEEMANGVKAVMDAENIKTAIIAGHSMGGYVSLAFADCYPEMLDRFILVHSTCYADDAEKIEVRKKATEFVKEGKKDLIISTAVPNTFATKNLKNFDKELKYIIEQAKNTKEDGICFALEAMMKRPDRSHVLKQNNIPYLLLIGEEDNCVSYTSSISQIYLSNKSKHTILKNSGHMGFIEEEELTRNAILDFLKINY